MDGEINADEVSPAKTKDLDLNQEQSDSSPKVEKPSQDSSQKHENRVGYAAIKQEFLRLDYKPILHSEYISEQVKRKLGVDFPKVLTKSEQASVPENDSNEQDNDQDEPPHKKAKLKGRNKWRPGKERILQKNKLCPAIQAGKECKYGENCKFKHDKKEFILQKLPDLKQTCPVFKHFGYCRCGISCRFAESHLSEQLDNIVNEELYAKMKDSLICQNILNEDVKQKLWKRKFNFSKALTSVKNAQKLTESSKERNSISGSEKRDEISLQSTELSFDEKTENQLNLAKDKDSIPEEDISASVLPKGDSNGEENKDGNEAVSEIVVTTESMDKSDIGQTAGGITDEEVIRLRPQERRKIDFRNKLYLAPLTTVGNLPFRRICKGLGADVTCGEMALASQLLKGKGSEWSLIKRHSSEDIFGVQVCGAYPDMMAKCAQVLTESMSLDFIDINCGCPIDLVFKKGAGSALLGKATKLEQICRSMIGVMDGLPLTVKIRNGVYDNKHVAHSLIPRLRDAGVSLVTLHGRSREQRYTKLADWEYISQCAQAGDPMPVFGNGDILSYEEANAHMQQNHVSGVMLARGALIKPWLFTEIKDQRHWDISSSERFDILKSYTNYGLEHWGSDQQGVENTRRFLLEWLSFLYRYIPVGVLEQVPQKINERPPYYIGRDDLETLMASANCADWIKISEMLLGPVPPNFKFLPKHKANAYQ